MLCGYGTYVLYFMLRDEYVLLLDDQFLDQETGHISKGDPDVVIRYLIHVEAILAFLLAACVFMGTPAFSMPRTGTIPLMANSAWCWWHQGLPSQSSLVFTAISWLPTRPQTSSLSVVTCVGADHVSTKTTTRAKPTAQPFPRRRRRQSGRLGMRMISGRSPQTFARFGLLGSCNGFTAAGRLTTSSARGGGYPSRANAKYTAAIL